MDASALVILVLIPQIRGKRSLTQIMPKLKQDLFLYINSESVTISPKGRVHEISPKPISQASFYKAKS